MESTTAAKLAISFILLAAFAAIHLGSASGGALAASPALEPAVLPTDPSVQVVVDDSGEPWVYVVVVEG